jgi:hypothetical protein
MVVLFICALIALVIFLLIDRKAAKTDSYWKGHDDGYFSAELTHAMMKMKEEDNDETTETEQQ